MDDNDHAGTDFPNVSACLAFNRIGRGGRPPKDPTRCPDWNAP